VTDEVDTRRVLEAEKNVVGSIVLLPEVLPEVAAIVRPQDFYEPAPRAVATAIWELHHAGLPIERPMILDRLRGSAEFANDTPAAYLLELAQDVVTASNAVHYAKQIVESRIKRDRIRHVQDWLYRYSNGHPTVDTDRELFATSSDWMKEREAGKTRDSFSYRDLQQAFPQLNLVVVDGWARQGETVNIIAPSKFGKSWLLHYLLLCIVVGRYIFDRFATTPGKVILIDNELHEPTLVHRIAAVAAAMGLGTSDYQDAFEVWPLRGRLPSLFDLRSRCLEIEPGTVQAIGYDAMYRFMPPGTSENDNGAMKEIYNALDAIAAHTNAVNFVIHHSSKGSQTDKRVTDIGAGAGSQSRAADTHLVLREHEEPGIAVLDAAVRSFAPMEPLAVRWAFPLWHPADDVDPTKLKGRLSPKQQQQSADDQEGCSKILTALVDGPATSTELGPTTGISRERRNRLLDWLCSQGSVEFEEITKRGNICRVYRLKDQPE
jgi:hypothetical protein